MQGTSLNLSPQQEEAIKAFKHWWRNERHVKPLFYIAGYGGTGKSTILPLLMDLTHLDLETTKTPTVAFMAPTAKAALVMRDKLHAQGLKQCNPRTIHHYLYVPVEDDLEDELTAMEKETDPALKARLHYELALKIQKRKVGFLAGTASRLVECELIVIDEGSMVGSAVAQDLLNLGLPILVMGDPGQLPPVQDVAGLTNGEPDVFLTEIHRQAKDNPIIYFASLLREGKLAPPGEYEDKLFIYTSAEAEDKVDIGTGQQIILGTHKKRWAVTAGLRMALHGVKRDTPPVAGEPIIVKRNHRRYPQIVNGSLGTVDETIQEWDLKTASATMSATIEGLPFFGEVYCGLFEEHTVGVRNYCSAGPRVTHDAQRRAVHMDWGYAITCHSAQGSQFGHPIVFDEGPVFRSDRWKWAYTAASRAVDRLTWII